MAVIYMHDGYKATLKKKSTDDNFNQFVTVYFDNTLIFGWSEHENSKKDSILEKVQREINNHKIINFFNGNLENNGDVLPPTKIYGLLIKKAVNDLSLFENVCRKNFGGYTAYQWAELFNMLPPTGSICCGHPMVLAESGICYVCTTCDNWEYSSS